MKKRTSRKSESETGDTKRTLERTGFLAFVDILGFSNIVGRSDYTKNVSKYVGILDQSINKSYMDLEYVTFSDSVVISTARSGQEKIELLLLAVAQINHRLVVELGWPVRGCVSWGTFYRTEKKENVLVAGTPIVDAYHFENEQGWVGVMLSPLISKETENEARIEGLVSQNLLARHETIPFGKSKGYTDKYDGYVVIPRSTKVDGSNDVAASLGEYRDALQKLKLESPDSKSQRKYEETVKWVDSYLQRGAATPT